MDAGGSDWIWNDNWLGKVRIRAEGASAKPLFIGIGPEPAVAGYLGRVAHADVEDIDIDPFRVTYRQVAGGRAGATANRPELLGGVGLGLGKADRDLGGA